MLIRRGVQELDETMGPRYVAVHGFSDEMSTHKYAASRRRYNDMSTSSAASTNSSSLPSSYGSPTRLIKPIIYSVVEEVI
jgi:hypothetical protein